MNVTDVFLVSGAVLASSGGAAAIIFGLSSWLGKVWANRILEQDKLRYSSELERIRNKLEVESQQRQLIFSLYFEGQFKLYNDLWISLVELQEGVENLWAEASSLNLRRFIYALAKAKKQIKNSALLIDSVHYQEIMQAIERFDSYQIGKERLVNARRINVIDQWEIERIIEQNRNSREQINAFVNRMLDKMRNQIGGLSEKTTS